MPATDKNFYDLKKVHVVFALSTCALMAVTLWMFAADHSDEWREHQSVKDRIDEQIANQVIQAALEAPIDGSKFSDRVRALIDGKSYKDAVELLQSTITEEEQTLANNEEKIQPHRDKLAAAERTLDLAQRDARGRRAERDVAAANHGIGVRDSVGEELLAGLLARLNGWKQKVAEIELAVETNQREVNIAKKAVEKQTAARDEVQAELKKLQADVILMQSALEQIAPAGLLMSLKHKVMEWPIIDGFNSHHKLFNDWLPDLKVTYGMATIPRYDRCRSCHLGIENVLAGNKPAYPFGKTGSDDISEWVKQNKFPHPYATHPNTELFVTAGSPHPRGRFGCTICHDGDGSGTSFQNAEHGPNSPHQHETWKDDYNYHPNHHWELPMLPKRLQEATCLKCHHQVDELGINPKFGNSAPNVYEGYQLIQRYGCFGCHEIRGFDGDLSIGPDLRLEPDYTALATQLLTDPWFQKLTEPFVAPVKRMTIKEILAASALVAANSEITSTQQAELRATIDAELESLAHAVAANPDETVTKRNRLMALSAADKLFANTRIMAQPRLTAGSHALAAELKNIDHAGRYRKVGPSLRHIAAKTTGAWIEHWTEEPKRFRPKTRMPQFFKLTNQQDAHAKKFMPVELAGIAHYLRTKSQPIDLEQPAAQYIPDPVRGRQAFSEKGCLACHQHDKFPKAVAEFGPNLTKTHLKIGAVKSLQGKVKRGEEFVDVETVDPASPGFKWLYTWILDPHRYHARTKMPNLFVDETVTADNDPAADIAAFLLMGGMGQYDSAKVGDEALDELVLTYLKKALPVEDAETTLQTGKYPVKAEKIKGDEIELAGDDDWRSRKLSYIGRRTISQYGCYGCHDIPGFERARPIGTTLQDWGRKDPHKLAPEHIHEWLAHHGEPDGSSTHHRVADLVKRGRSGEFQTRQAEDAALSATYFYNSLVHHGRDGFLWQKLRQPRSYDYEKTELKGYDERLRMPKFPLTEDEIEKISTFVLGLVSDPPAEEYLYTPTGPAADRIGGEQLLQKYNCIGCHMVELPEITFGADLDSLPFFTQLDPSTYADAFEHLLKVKPPQDADTGRKLPTGETILRFKGLKLTDPFTDEDPEDQFYTFNSWTNLKIGDKLITMENPKLEVYVQNLVSIKPARGGAFAEWMVAASQTGETPDLALRDKTWQAAPPPLIQEGIKVQTPWLYRFLREPYRIRHTTRLRMPRFNMSPDEARTLANYFAAVDGAPYPYQEVPERDPAYLAAKERSLSSLIPAGSSYLNESWQLLNTSGTKGLCVKCHSVGGRQFKSTGAKGEVRGPDLDRVAERLRPDWTLLWLTNPKWIAPYTGMARIFNPKQKLLENRFEGHGRLQTIGARDALMNYHRLSEQIGKTPDPPKVKADAKTQPDNNSGD